LLENIIYRRKCVPFTECPIYYHNTRIECGNASSATHRLIYTRIDEARRGTMTDTQVDRSTLGSFMSMVCFRYLAEGAEQLAGQAMLVDAGRHRGRDLITELGLANTHEESGKLCQQLDDALGVNGTRLCIVKSVVETETGCFEIYIEENVSTHYTIGVLIGAISTMTGKTMLGKDMGEQGANGRIFHITPL
jgi:hypothetical protein